MTRELRPVDLHLLNELRSQHAGQMNGPVQSYSDSLILAPGALHAGMYVADRLRGYACYSPEDKRGGRTLLEIFVAPGHRRSQALPFLCEVVSWVAPTHWEVSSYDRFALSLAANAGYRLDRTDALLFTLDSVQTGQAADFPLEKARPEELEEMRPVLMEDDFYTGDWRRLPFEMEIGLWYNLRSPGGALVGIGYLDPAVRAPGYADVGMVVTSRWRRQGHGSRILQGLVGASLQKGMKPVAICAWDNAASRRALERAGFYCDGRVWKVRPESR